MPIRTNAGSEEAYLQLLDDVLTNGTRSDNRTGVATYKVFGRFWECEDVMDDFPLLTTKRIHWKSVVAELLWFLSGSTNVKPLQEMGCTIWDEWADEHGELGPIYGYQWRSWTGFDSKDDELNEIDQIAEAVNLLKHDPDSRRILVSAWNVADLVHMSLNPCHYAFQLQVQNGELNMLVNMRSIDIFLGMPFNIASYALLLRMFAHVTGYRASRLCFSLGDLHIYENHIEQVKTQLARPQHEAPRVALHDRVQSIFDFTPDDIALVGYEHSGVLKGEVAV